MEKEILPSTSFKSLDDVCQKYYGKNSFYNNRLENCICSNGKIPIGDEICDSSIIIPTVQNQEKMKCGFRAHQTTKNNCECDSGFVFVSPDDSENSNCRATRIHKTTKRKRTYTKPQSSKRLIRATTNRRFNSKYK